MELIKNGNKTSEKTIYKFDSFKEAFERAPGIVKTLKNTQGHNYQIDNLSVVQVDPTYCLLLSDPRGKREVFEYHPFSLEKGAKERIKTINKGNFISITGLITDLNIVTLNFLSLGTLN